MMWLCWSAIHDTLCGSLFDNGLRESRMVEEEEVEEDFKFPKFCSELATANRLLARPSLEQQEEEDRLFVQCGAPTLFGRYRYSGQWLLCRIRSVDINDTCTIVWEDGTMQMGTKAEELLMPTKKIALEIKKLLSQKRRDAIPPPITASTSSSSQEEEITVWEAAKRGDLATTLAIIDRGDATPNDPEILDETSGLQGRSPLYWACFGGHVELVRELLARGGIDFDGAAYIAVTSREKADDDRDLMFNPDDGVFSDYVDYDPSATTKNSEKEKEAHDDEALIHAMLLAARSSQTKSIQSQMLPTRLYKQPEQSCVICLEKPADAVPTPCGHVTCCLPCLTLVRDNRDGCPICRGRIVAIVQRGKTENVM